MDSHLTDDLPVMDVDEGAGPAKVLFRVDQRRRHGRTGDGGVNAYGVRQQRREDARKTAAASAMFGPRVRGQSDSCLWEKKQGGNVISAVFSEHVDRRQDIA